MSQHDDRLPMLRMLERAREAVDMIQGRSWKPKGRVQGRFRHDRTEYRLWVTDPGYERAYLAKPDGEYKMGESFLTISLGEPFNDACYKLIAAIVQRDEGADA